MSEQISHLNLNVIHEDIMMQVHFQRKLLEREQRIIMCMNTMNTDQFKDKARNIVRDMYAASCK